MVILIIVVRVGSTRGIAERNPSRQAITSRTAASKIVKNQLLGDKFSHPARLSPSYSVDSSAD
ncbi:hypothetical protein [Rhodanobacter sp. B04]|uniref:hypothetical protein n=1 Tax=Rhodanobacter sp. B04 TaxID=1945860 RepID=UPI0011155B7A|nr:hypothetical protein [Rhodanobacter sp. B04]